MTFFHYTFDLVAIYILANFFPKIDDSHCYEPLLSRSKDDSMRKQPVAMEEYCAKY